MAEGGSGSAGGSSLGGIIGALQQIFGGHGAGTGRSSSRASQQIAFAVMQLAQRAAVAQRLASTYEEAARRATYEQGFMPGERTAQVVLPPVNADIKAFGAALASLTARGKGDTRRAKAIQGRLNRAVALAPPQVVRYVRPLDDPHRWRWPGLSTSMFQ